MATSYDKPMLMTEQMMQQKELAVLKDYPMDKVTPVESAGENYSYIAVKRNPENEATLTILGAGALAGSALYSFFTATLGLVKHN